MSSARVSLVLSVGFVLILAPMLTAAEETPVASTGLRGVVGDGSSVAGSSDPAEVYAGAAALPVLSNATVSQTEVGCSDDDMVLINAKGGGHNSGSFPEIVGRCGKKAYSMWTGFHSNYMNQCIRKEVPISESCASCYVLIGKHAAANCKWACLWGSWCRQSCLDCNEKVRDPVNTCVAHESPQPDHC
eukprot:TRINITY_DN9386_c1_g7_i1.p1 TRINITY_DN9386_c1_g7~~TRINITY_DN9386_c1_g7_i1.p1  ORF type:complete len:188 (-),score=34.54 TRINITY_DN9386_c1_g7_i1:228-791(-)